MVASSSFGFDNSLTIFIEFGVLLFLQTSSCFGDSEKNATSDPEMSAESSNKMIEAKNIGYMITGKDITALKMCK
jgi:hypothetical protein